MEREARRTAELLAAHAGGLRALAFELVGDRHAAEDVLQDAFLRSVGRVPASASASGVRAWLREVVRGLALNHKRGAAHRAEREAAHARASASRAGEDFERDAREKGEALQRVVSAVLALDEPYKSTVLARYFEGLGPTEIAARANVSLATVASRLQRAHQKLRAELERERGGLALALAPLLGTDTGLGVGPLAPSLGKGILVMGTKSVAAACVVLVGLLVWWLVASGPENVPSAAGGLATAGAEGSVGAVALESSATAPIEPAERAAASASGAVLANGGPSSSLFGPGPYEYELELTVVDLLGRPQSRAEVRAAPFGQPLVAFGTTAWNGRLVTRWRAFEPVLELVVQASSSGEGVTELRKLRLAAGVCERATVVLPRADQSGLASAIHLLTRARVYESSMVVTGALERDGTPAEFRVDEQGNGVFDDPFLQDEAGGVPVLEGLPILGRFFAAEISVAVEYEVTSGSPAEGGPPAPVTHALTGRLRRADGAPESALLVVVSTGDGKQTTQTEEDGSFQFQHLPPGPLLLCAGGVGSGIVIEELVVGPATKELDLRLDDRGVLFLRLVDEAGEPLVGWRVEAWADANEREFVRGAVTDEDGRALLHDVGVAPLHLSARPVTNDAPSVLGRRIAHGVFAQKEELVLEVPGGSKLARVELVLASASGLPSAGGLVWLERDDGLELVPVLERVEGEGPEERRSWSLDRVLCGLYRIVAAAPLEGWMDLGRYEIGPGASLALGERRFPSRARAKIESEGELRVTDARIHVLRAGSVSRSSAFSARFPTELAIPFGPTRIDWVRSAVAEETAEDVSAPPEVESQPGPREIHELEGRPGATVRLVVPRDR